MFRRFVQRGARAFRTVTRQVTRRSAKRSSSTAWKLVGGAGVMMVGAPVLNLSSMDEKVSDGKDYDLDFNALADQYAQDKSSADVSTEDFVGAFSAAREVAQQTVVCIRSQEQLTEGETGPEQKAHIYGSVVYAVETLNQLFFLQVAANQWAQEHGSDEVKKISTELTNSYFDLLVAAAKSAARFSKQVSGSVCTGPLDAFSQRVLSNGFPSDVGAFLGAYKKNPALWPQFPTSFAQALNQGNGSVPPRTAELLVNSPVSPVGAVVSEWVTFTGYMAGSSLGILLEQQDAKKTTKDGEAQKSAHH